MISLLGVGGFNMAVDKSVYWSSVPVKDGIDRDYLMLPEVILDNYNVDLSSLLKPFFERDRILKDKIFYTPEVYIGGVMKGHYNDVLETPVGIVRELNASLALVTPCYQLREILMSDKARQQRAKLPDPHSIPDESIPYGLERAKL